MRELFYKAQSRKATAKMAKARRLVKLLAAVGLTFALAASAWAMPTKKQLVEAQRIVKEITADDLRDLKAKKKTAGDVAAGHLALADKADYDLALLTKSTLGIAEGIVTHHSGNYSRQDNKAEQYDKPDIFRLRHLGAHFFTHGRHGHFRHGPRHGAGGLRAGAGLPVPGL